MVSRSTKIAAGAYIANDRSIPATTYDGIFAYLMATFDPAHLFKSSKTTPSMNDM